MAKVITISTQKGGVAKTSTAISIASYLARKNVNVLLIDVDAQCNSSYVLFPDFINIKSKLNIFEDTICTLMTGDENHELKIHNTNLPHLKIIPSHNRLAEADVLLSSAMSRESLLKTALVKFRNVFDFIIIDTPPNIGVMTINALVASDYVIIPASPNSFDMDAIGIIIKKVNQIKIQLNQKLEILGILLTLREPTRLSLEIHNYLKSTFPDKLFITSIPKNIAVAEANSKSIDIFGHAPHSNAAKFYADLVDNEILPKLNFKYK